MRRSILFVLLFPLVASAAPLSVRGALGYEQSLDTVLRDVDCSSTNPPAIFGCGFEARGDFGSFFVPELAIGAELPMRTRVELAVARRSFDLDLRANFRNTPDPQLVRGAGRTTTLMLSGAIDLTSTRVRPFVTAGAGVAHHSLDRVNFLFPAIAPDAVTIAQGGTRNTFAWNAGLGVSYTVTPSLAVDVMARWQNLGELETDAGHALIVRPNRVLDLDVAGLRMDVRSAGISVGVRWRSRAARAN